MRISDWSSDVCSSDLRDGLSILDQAIAHADMEGESKVTAAQVRDMLGLSDRGAVRRLFGHVLEGNACEVLSAVQEQHVLGVEPLARSEEHTSELQSLMRISYAVFCLKKKNKH